MKRLILCLTVVCVAALPVAALAGDFHVGSLLPCFDCHNMHYSQTHAYSADISSFPLPALEGGPNAYLLRQPANELCLSCHDNAGAFGVIDVFGVNSGTEVREAGGLNAAQPNPAGKLNDTGYDEGDGHTLWTHATAPGGTWAPPASSEGLECVQCHAQHGIATQWRNLLNRSDFSGKTLNYAVGTNVDTVDVYENATRSYDVQFVNFNEPISTTSRYAAWCGTCHTNFHGNPGAGSNVGGPAPTNPFIRHPVGGQDVGAAGSGGYSALSRINAHPATNRVKMLMKNSAWNNATITAADSPSPSCMSCHKAHGSKNSFGLIFMSGVGAVTEEGDDGATYTDGSKYIALCKQCHGQASGYVVGAP